MCASVAKCQLGQCGAANRGCTCQVCVCDKGKVRMCVCVLRWSCGLVCSYAVGVVDAWCFAHAVPPQPPVF